MNTIELMLRVMLIGIYWAIGIFVIAVVIGIIRLLVGKWRIKIWGWWK